jgi:hypothetical protein
MIEEPNFDDDEPWLDKDEDQDEPQEPIEEQLKQNYIT